MSQGKRRMPPKATPASLTSARAPAKSTCSSFISTANCCKRARSFAVTGKQPDNVRVLTQAARRAQYSGNIVGQTQGPEVGDDEPASEIELLANSLAASGRIEHPTIDPVRDQAYFVGVDPLLHQVLAICRRVNHDVTSPGVEKTFKRSRQRNQYGVLQYPHANGKVRPKIAHFQSSGFRRRNATAHAEAAWKIGGDVPITRSIGPARSPAQSELHMKLKEEKPPAR